MITSNVKVTSQSINSYKFIENLRSMVTKGCGGWGKKKMSNSCKVGKDEYKLRHRGRGLSGDMCGSGTGMAKMDGNVNQIIDTYNRPN